VIHVADVIDSVRVADMDMVEAEMAEMAVMAAGAEVVGV